MEQYKFQLIQDINKAKEDEDYELLAFLKNKWKQLEYYEILT